MKQVIWSICECNLYLPYWPLFKYAFPNATIARIQAVSLAGQGMHPGVKIDGWLQAQAECKIYMIIIQGRHGIAWFTHGMFMWDLAQNFSQAFLLVLQIFNTDTPPLGL
jgi:hypothetical protein